MIEKYNTKNTIEFRNVQKCVIESSVVQDISDGKPMKSFSVALRAILYAVYKYYRTFLIRGGLFCVFS